MIYLKQQATMLENLVVEMYSKSDRNSNMSEVSKNSLSCVKQKHGSKDASEENKGRDNENKRSAEISRKMNCDTNEGND